MSADLFPIDESLSPRLTWMRKHGVVIIHLEPDPDAYDGGSYKQWKAYVPDHPDRYVPGFGDSGADGEDQALENFAMFNNMPLWYQQ